MYVCEPSTDGHLENLLEHAQDVSLWVAVEICSASSIKVIMLIYWDMYHGIHKVIENLSKKNFNFGQKVTEIISVQDMYSTVFNFEVAPKLLFSFYSVLYGANSSLDTAWHR